jgi:hypothetical protein
MANLSKADKEANLTAAQIRLRKEKALCSQRELQLRLLEGKLLSRADVVRVWSEMLCPGAGPAALDPGQVRPRADRGEGRRRVPADRPGADRGCAEGAQPQTDLSLDRQKQET